MKAWALLWLGVTACGGHVDTNCAQMVRRFCEQAIRSLPPGVRADYGGDAAVAQQCIRGLEPWRADERQCVTDLRALLR